MAIIAATPRSLSLGPVPAMEFYLFRHGIAFDAAPGQPDSARELTREGREKVAAVGRLARRSGVSPSLILSSPYVRAVQTAQIAVKEFVYTGPELQLASLVPHGTAAAVWNDLRDHSDERAILIAGHEPLLGVLGAYLLGTPELRIEMKKATMLRIDLPDTGRSRTAPPRGTLRWMLTAGLASANHRS